MTYLSSQLGLKLRWVFTTLWGCLSEPGLSVYISLPAPACHNGPSVYGLSPKLPPLYYPRWSRWGQLGCVQNGFFLQSSCPRRPRS